MKNIIESIRKQYPVSDLTIKELESYLTPCSFPKRYQLIKEGIYCKYAYFIEKGILRAYWVVDGEEYTTSFGAEGCIVFSMDELYYNKKSEEYVETLEEVEAYRINISDLKKSYGNQLGVMQLGGESYIRMNTDGCTEAIKRGCHCRQRSVMKSFRNNFRKYAKR
mgnify:CR=1 FL=1